MDSWTLVAEPHFKDKNKSAKGTQIGGEVTSPALAEKRVRSAPTAGGDDLTNPPRTRPPCPCAWPARSLGRALLWMGRGQST
eukprot:10846182-Alexandrium_andersonii.AAC.1